MPLWICGSCYQWVRRAIGAEDQEVAGETMVLVVFASPSHLVFDVPEKTFEENCPAVLWPLVRLFVAPLALGNGWL